MQTSPEANIINMTNLTNFNFDISLSVDENLLILNPSLTPEKLKTMTIFVRLDPMYESEEPSHWFNLKKLGGLMNSHLLYWSKRGPL